MWKNKSTSDKSAGAQPLQLSGWLVLGLGALTKAKTSWIRACTHCAAMPAISSIVQVPPLHVQWGHGKLTRICAEIRQLSSQHCTHQFGTSWFTLRPWILITFLLYSFRTCLFHRWTIWICFSTNIEYEFILFLLRQLDTHFVSSALYIASTCDLNQKHRWTNRQVVFQLGLECLIWWKWEFYSRVLVLQHWLIWICTCYGGVHEGNRKPDWSDLNNKGMNSGALFGKLSKASRDCAIGE